MNNENRDYIFYIRWEDGKKKRYHVGLLAKINEEFYLIMTGKRNSEEAFENGFIGLTGFKPGEVYKSNELFDFFERRILNKNVANQCEELERTNGVSLVDSFSVREVSKKKFDKYKANILSAYEIQCKKEEIKKTSKEIHSK